VSLKNIFLRVGRKLLGGKKESATAATGKQQKLLTYEGKVPQETGLQLAKKELANPPVIRKQTKSLYMGDDVAPAFGSSTYDWAMKIGPGRYSADEWLNHLTSTRKVNFKVFGKPATKTVRDPKQFTYDSGTFAGRKATISKEELFDTNLAVFDDTGNLTGGLLFAAKKFGLKLDANEIGNMIKLNPINRLKPVELGASPAAKEAFEKSTSALVNQIRGFKLKYRQDIDIANNLDDALYYINGIKNDISKSGFTSLRESLKKVKARPVLTEPEKKLLNKLEADLNAKVSPLRATKTQYAGESQYTLQGGKDYRETIFRLSEDIPGNRSARTKPGHFSDAGDNQIYHVRFDTRFTPDGKKGFLIHEIQSDVNQSIAKQLTKSQQLSGVERINPFQADIEMGLLINNRSKLLAEIDDAIEKGLTGKVQRISGELRDINTKIRNTYSRDPMANKVDYFPMVEADQYGDHALKYLMNKAAKENVDFVAVAPFDKLSFRQGYKAGNERFYGYASGKGIDKKGAAVMPDLMKKAARFYGSKAESVKLSLSDPKKIYKKIETNKFEYPEKHKLSRKKITSKYHSDASETPMSGYKEMQPSDPSLYFDAFAIKVNPLMKYTQKTYKASGGLVVDIFKSIR